MTPAQPLAFAERDWQVPGHTSVGWPALTRAPITRVLLKMGGHLSALGHADAATKYAAFALTSAWPIKCRLTYLASYLGITPQSLSRVRRSRGRSLNAPT